MCSFFFFKLKHTLSIFLLCCSFVQTFDCNRVCLSELEFTSDFSLKITNTTECTVSVLAAL